MKILVLDDAPQSAIAKHLEENEVIVLRTVRDALENLRKGPQQPDAVLMNVSMPLMLALEAGNRGIPVLILEAEHAEWVSAMLHLLFELSKKTDDCPRRGEGRPACSVVIYCDDPEQWIQDMRKAGLFPGKSTA